MMEAAIQRRFPAGVKVHVQSSDRFGCLAELTHTLHDNQLSITRAKVRRPRPSCTHGWDAGALSAPAACCSSSTGAWLLPGRGNCVGCRAEVKCLLHGYQLCFM